MKKIYINPGHSEKDPGAVGYETERRLNVAVCKHMNDYLLENYVCETKVNSGDSLYALADEANAWGADYFISLHTNASVSQAPSGTEAYVFSIPSAASRLADEITEKISEFTGLRDRGVFARPSLYILRKTAMPAVLCELGFISNPRDASLMANSPELFARAIYEGILDYLGLN